MTTQQMIPLLDHADPMVRKQAKDYGDLFDAASDYTYEVEKRGLDSDHAREEYERLQAVMRKQPNVCIASQRL